jgi:hypothetical protein
MDLNEAEFTPAKDGRFSCANNPGPPHHLGSFFIFFRLLDFVVLTFLLIYITCTCGGLW